MSEAMFWALMLALDMFAGGVIFGIEQSKRKANKKDAPNGSSVQGIVR